VDAKRVQINSQNTAPAALIRGCQKVQSVSVPENVLRQQLDATGRVLGQTSFFDQFSPGVDSHEFGFPALKLRAVSIIVQEVHLPGICPNFGPTPGDVSHAVGVLVFCNSISHHPFLHPIESNRGNKNLLNKQRNPLQVL
jgi:hypothetical protein